MTGVSEAAGKKKRREKAERAVRRGKNSKIPALIREKVRNFGNLGAKPT